MRKGPYIKSKPVANPMAMCKRWPRLRRNKKSGNTSRAATLVAKASASKTPTANGAPGRVERHVSMAASSNRPSSPSGWALVMASFKIAGCNA